MKVLILKPGLLVRVNGGDIALIEKLQWLAREGHEVKIRCILAERHRASILQYLRSMSSLRLKDEGYEVDGLFVDMCFHPVPDEMELPNQAQYEGIFLKYIESDRPDRVWTHYTDFFATSAALQWNSECTWVDQTDNEYPRLLKLDEFGNLGTIYRSVRHMVVASPFMRRQVRRDFPRVNIHYLPNRLHGFELKSESSLLWNENAPWLFVNPIPVKGVEFILQLAEACPEQKFLFVGNWHNERPDRMPKNIHFLPRQDSLEPIFKRVKGLLFPSAWEEAFGRTPLEAMATGCPVIGSNRGGLPETIGSGGLVLPLDTGAWVEALHRPASFWKELIDAGRRRFHAYRNEVEEAYRALRL